MVSPAEVSPSDGSASAGTHELVQRVVGRTDEPTRKRHDQATSRRAREKESGAPRPVRIEGHEAHELPRPVTSGAHGKGIPLSTHAQVNLAARPVGNRRNRPVRHLAGNHGPELRSAVGKLDTGLDPVVVVVPDHDSRLVELLVVVEHPAHFNRRSISEIVEKSVPVVVNEVVRRCAPKVAVRLGGHLQGFTIIQDGCGGIEPYACAAVNFVHEAIVSRA